jgi:hypothetical protein
MKPVRPRQAHRRHTRKYAEGELSEDLSFYFAGRIMPSISALKT